MGGEGLEALMKIQLYYTSLLPFEVRFCTEYVHTYTSTCTYHTEIQKETPRVCILKTILGMYSLKAKKRGDILIEGKIISRT